MTTISIRAILNIRKTVILYKSIHNIITQVLTLSHVFFIERYEIIFVVVVDELQNVIQSIVVFQKFFDLFYSLSSEDFFVVHGQSDGHLVDLFGMNVDYQGLGD